MREVREYNYYLGRSINSYYYGYTNRIKRYSKIDHRNLSILISKGHFRAVRLILRFGLPIWLRDAIGGVLVDNDFPDVVLLMIKHQVGPSLETLFAYAIRREFIQMIYALFPYGNSNYHRECLYDTMKRDRPFGLKALLRLGLKPNTDHLESAAEEGNLSMVKILIRNGVYSHLAIRWASFAGRSEIVKYLDRPKLKSVR